MGIFGIMRTGVSGMAAQASRLSAVSDNIANVNTIGYKRAGSDFSTLITGGKRGEYNSGGVQAQTRYAVSEEGVLAGSTSRTDLAIRGRGFFIVSDASGKPFLTRAGAFVPTAQKDLVNSAGFYLMGYPLKDGNPSVIANSLDGLKRVNLADVAYEATPTTSGSIKGVLDSGSAVIPAANLPSANATTSTYSSKNSIVTYDNLGNKVFLDVYTAKTGVNPDSWQTVIYDKSKAAANGGFPYAAPPLATVAQSFGANGQLASTTPANPTLAIPGGGTMTLDMSQISQVGTGKTALQLSANGNAPSSVDNVEIASDGTVYAIFANGNRRATFKIPLADVPSPDKLSPETGNVYSVSNDSGNVSVGFPQSGSLGTLISGALELSNVDLATELTGMIESQRSYTASSKVFQTGSEILDVLVNLKR